MASYELCRLSSPLRSWHLPHPDTLEFCILTTRSRYGHFRASITGRHELSFSASTIGSLDTLNRTMLHEICHLQQYRIDPGEKAHHGRTWKALAARVCLYHHLDPKAF